MRGSDYGFRLGPWLSSVAEATGFWSRCRGFSLPVFSVGTSEGSPRLGLWKVAS